MMARYASMSSYISKGRGSSRNPRCACGMLMRAPPAPARPTGARRTLRRTSHPLGRHRDPAERLATPLDEFYAYYRSAGGMIKNLLRDEATVPIVAELFTQYHQFLQAAAEMLMCGGACAARPASASTPRWATR